MAQIVYMKRLKIVKKNDVNSLHVGEFTFIRYINIDIFLLPQYLNRANHIPQ